MNEKNKVENENFPCEYCGAVFEKSHLHRKHMKNHINETKKEAGARDQREFRCRFCDLPFDKAQALGGHMNRHHDERAKEKIKSVVNMYGINSVQSLMAQMPGANMQGQTLQAIQRPSEVNMHGHLANEAILQDPNANFQMVPHQILATQNLTYPSNAWQPHQQHYAQQQTTVGFAQQMDQGVLSRAPTYLPAQPGMLERQQYPLSTHNIGGIGPSNRKPYTRAPGGFETQRPQSTHTPNSTSNTMFNITILQGQHSGGDFEPESYLLEQENEGHGFMSSPSMSQGYGGFKSKPRDD